MAIADQTINSNVWTTVKTIILAAAPKVSEVINGVSITKTASVSATYNDKDTKMPCIAINPASISESDYKFGQNTGKRFINVGVECYYPRTVGTDQLADQVIYAISQADISGMELVGFDSDQAFVDPNQAKFQLKTITFTFERE